MKSPLQILKCILVFGLLFCTQHAGFAQGDSSSVKLLGLPVIFSSPEVGVAFGGFGVMSFEAESGDTLTPTSQIQLGAVYTTENQLLLYAPFEIYSSRRRWTLRGELGYYIYSYLYFGEGDNTVVDGEIYELTFPRVRIDGLRALSANLYGGLQYDFDKLNITKLDQEGLLIQGVRGAEGGVISGIGPIAEYDTRDNVYSARAGVFASVRAALFDRAFLSDYNYRSLEVDLRCFKTYGELTLGVQGNFESNSAEVPFTRLSLVGGGKTMRGYYRGRYRDQKLWQTQAEIRRKVKGRFGAAAFLGVAETFEKNMDFRGLNWGGGIGVRFALIPARRINLRLDYAEGEGDSSGFYFTIGEAF